MNTTPDFGKIVNDYERLSEPLTSVVARQALQLVEISPGEQVIDVAAGTGALAVAVAEQGARVLATDVAPPMVVRAAERLRPFPGCEARVMDFGALEAPDNDFAASFSIFGVMMFPGWEAGLRELLRVTRPGGRIAVTAWVQGEDGGPAYLMKRVFEETFPGRELWPDDFFPRWSQESFAQALRQAGCAEVSLRVCCSAWTQPSAAGVMGECEPILRLFPGYAALTDAERSRLRGPVEAAVAVYFRPDGSISIPALVYVGLGRKSA